MLTYTLLMNQARLFLFLLKPPSSCLENEKRIEHLMIGAVSYDKSYRYEVLSRKQFLG